MSKGKGQVQETAMDRALAEVGMQEWKRFKTETAPHIKKFAADATASMQPGSKERSMTTAQSNADVSAAFAGAGDKALDAVSQSGTSGSSGQKLGITGMGADAATSVSLSSVAADESVTRGGLQKLATAAALGRGEKVNALEGMNKLASLSGAQARADAEQSLEEHAGRASLAAGLVGAGYGSWMGADKTPGSLDDPRAGVRGQLGYGGG